MERYLKLENLRMALGGQRNLPSAEELQRLMAEAEINLFTGRKDISDSLIKTAWYLHSIASSRKSLELYDYDRQRRAYQISAHIFDVATQKGDRDRNEALSYVFAAQIGYLRGGLNPNATALYRSIDQVNRSLDIADSNVALEIGVMLLAMDRRTLFEVLPLLQERLGTFEDIQEGNLNDLRLLLDACWSLLLFLSYGRDGSYSDAVTGLESVVRNDTGVVDLDTRWVAAHLLDIAEDFGQSSIWSILPPGVPPAAANAMTLGIPPVLNLWPPQMQLLKQDDSNNPLLLSTKRLFLSIPTSAGKTLLAQFIAVTHLAQDGGGICFVAPSHSLCREIRKSLSDRLRLLKQEVAEDIPLGFLDELGDIESEGTKVEVMTPERLGFMLRHRPKETLNQFKLFIIDEAHLIADENRGWGLEATLSLLHMLTRGSEQRIVLMSSALGAQAHIMQWIGEDGANRSFHSDWRGPRRLYAIYTTQRKAAEELTHHNRRSGQEETHYKYQLDGVVKLKLADTSGTYTATLSEPVGEQYTKPDGQGRYHPDSKKSTPFYKTIAPLVLDLAESGPVLVIVSTRTESQNLAREIANRIPADDDQTARIATLASARLGDEHLLTKVLKKGVAFHHAALPSDLQIAIETGVKNGQIKYLVSTTTLADGVNLPVRTVVIGNTGTHTSGGFREFITGSKLVNAIGRAGRSGKESEGWIVLADPHYDPTRFDELMQANPMELSLASQLSSEAALTALVEAENALRANEDDIFALERTQVSDFLSYIWVVANTLQEVRDSVSEEDIDQFFESTLAWQQMDETSRAKWSGMARKAFNAYENTATETRRRWARSGTSLPTSKKLEDVLLAVLEKFLSRELEEGRALDGEEALDIVLASSNIDLFFSLPEAPKTAFYAARNSRRSSPLGVDHRALLLDWINGTDLTTLVDTYLSTVSDKEYAFECMGDYITNVCEHYLPWIIGTIVTWANESSQSVTDNKLISPLLPALIRYGINNNHAVELMMNGVTSRLLAIKVASVFMGVDDPSLRLWLQRKHLADFIELFGADESEQRDLLNYLRPKETTILADFINGREIELDYSIRSDTQLSGEVRFAYLDSEGFPSRLGVRQMGIMTCDMPLRFYVDVEELLETGLPYKAELFINDSGNYGVKIRMITFGEDNSEDTDTVIDLDDIEF
jgi:replicative superfamily II helicase